MFFYNRLNGDMRDSLKVSDHQILRENPDAIEEAIDVNWIERLDDGNIKLVN